MVKNALEASAEGETVAMGVRPIDSEVEFWVHNSGSIPRNQQLQVFQRSFSTKDRNRGLGTYSMKLLAENYLSGRVAFESTPEEGTTFRLRIPFQAPPPSGVERPAAS
jgi:sensor histidine kinase regulating citrate/malate metabolism